MIDFELPFNISTDASGYAVSGILSQSDEQGTEKPIAFTSRKLSQSQEHAWSTIEKEAYAVIHSLSQFRDWILFSKVYIFSDHNPLQYLTENAPKSSKLTRGPLRCRNLTSPFTTARENKTSRPTLYRVYVKNLRNSALVADKQLGG